MIKTSTQITAHHKGFVEFKLCPRNDETMTADELQVVYIQTVTLRHIDSFKPGDVLSVTSPEWYKM